MKVIEMQLKNGSVNREGGERITVHTFGGLVVYYHGAPVTIMWESQKARLLFCYLLVFFDSWIHRDKLVEMLWPGCDKVAGAKNFKTTLSRLRKSFAGAHSINPVITQGDAVKLDSSSIGLDSSQFRYHATTGLKMLARGENIAARKYLEAAQDLYTGQFLPEEPFNDLLTSERRDLEVLHDSVISSLEKVYRMEGNTDAVEAIAVLRKFVSVDEPA